MKSLAVGKVDETSPSPSLSSAAMSPRRGTPKGLPALLNKMVRAVLISKPLQEVQFFADYLDAEVNRRTLCQLQDLKVTTVCDMELFEPENIQSLSSRVVRAATREQFHVSASRDEQSGKGCARKPESKCIAVQTDRNHLRYMTRCPFIQKMEAELISSVVENLNQDHVCRCNCPPPPLFWYKIIRPQVLRKCRKPIAAPAQKKALMSEVSPERREVEDDANVVVPIETKTAPSPDDKASKLRAANDAGLARIIDRELRPPHLPPPPPPPPPAPPRPKTTRSVERRLKVDASSQVETLVIQPKLHLQKQDLTAEHEVEHKYVQTMDDDVTFRPEETAIPDHSDLPSDPLPDELDEPASIPHPDAITAADESADQVDWSPFSEPPPQSRSSTDWLNIQLKDISDYDTDWGEMTRAVPVEPEEPFIDWLSADLRAQLDPHRCGRVSPPPPPPPPPPPSQEVVLDEPAVQPPEDRPDEDDDEPAVQPPEDRPDEDVRQRPLSRPESPARMTTPDAEDVLTGCEDSSLLLGPDDVNPVVVLQWNPIVIEPDAGDAQPLDIPVIVSQCPEPSDEQTTVHDHILPANQDLDLDPRDLVLQELTPKSTEVSSTEVVVQMPHPAETSPDNAMVKQVSDHNEISPNDEMEKQVSHDNMASPKDGMLKQVSDHNEVSPNDEMEKQVSHDNMASPKDGMLKQESDHNEVSSKDEILKQASDQNVLSSENETGKQASDQNELFPKDELLKQVSEDNLVSSKNEMLKQVSGHNEVAPKDDLVKQAPDQNEVSQENEMLKEVFGEEVLSSSSMFKIETTEEETTAVHTEFAAANEVQGSTPTPVHSDMSVKKKVNSSYKELNDVESRKGAAGAAGPEEEFMFGDTTRTEEKEKQETRDSSEPSDSGRSPLDTEKDDQNDEDGEKERGQEGEDKPAAEKEQELEKDRLEHGQQEEEYAQKVSGTETP